jgi:hypothetical protein
MAKKTEKLIPGGWGWPHDRSQAQRLFFLAIEGQAPEVLETLRDDVLPVYRQIEEETGRAPQPTDDLLLGHIWGWAEQHHLVVDRDDDQARQNTEVPAGEPETLAEIRNPDNVSPVRQFFLGWVLFAAYGTLKAWAGPQGPPAELRWTLPLRDFELGIVLEGARDLDRAAAELFTPGPAEAPPEYHFRVAAWHPIQETRAECETRVLEEVRRQLKVQLDQADRLYRQVLGLRPTKRVAATRHFDWLVRYQVQRKPLLQIANGCSPSATTPSVWQGVRAAAELVIGPGWEGWLRHAPRGRPPKH